MLCCVLAQTGRAAAERASCLCTLLVIEALDLEHLLRALAAIGVEQVCG